MSIIGFCGALFVVLLVMWLCLRNVMAWLLLAILTRPIRHGFMDRNTITITFTFTLTPNRTTFVLLTLNLILPTLLTLQARRQPGCICSSLNAVKLRGPVCVSAAKCCETWQFISRQNVGRLLCVRSGTHDAAAVGAHRISQWRRLYSPNQPITSSSYSYINFNHITQKHQKVTILQNGRQLTVKAHSHCTTRFIRAVSQ